MLTKQKLEISISADSVGMPQEWPELLQQSGADVGCVADILKIVDSNKGQRRIKDIVRHHFQQIPRFLASCPHLTFIFVGWDDEQFSLIQRCGPNRHRVSSLLRRPGLRRSRRKHSSADDCEAVWNAVEIITEEIDRQNRFRFVLLRRIDDDRLAELSHSGDFTRQEAWGAIRDSVPIEFRERVPAEPPPDRFELEKTLIEPAAPTEQFPNPKLVPSIPWHKYQKQNFDRDPAWRWNRAWSLAQNGCYFSHKRDDQETGCAVRFLRGLQLQRDTLRTYNEMPDMILAHDIWKEGGDRRLELEARLLSRQASPEIAERMEFSADAVDAYIDTFFDIRNRLDSRTYITKKVIGAQWAASLNPREGLLYSIAYFGGAGMLEAVLRYFHNHGQLLAELTSEETVQDPIATRLDLLLRAHSMPGDSKTALRMASIFPELMSDATASSAESYVGVLSRIVPPLPQDVVQSDVEHVETREHVAA